jgi:hypothetical protein
MDEVLVRASFCPACPAFVRVLPARCLWRAGFFLPGTRCPGNRAVTAHSHASGKVCLEEENFLIFVFLMLTESKYDASTPNELKLGRRAHV